MAKFSRYLFVHCRYKCLEPPLFQDFEGTITSAEINDIYYESQFDFYEKK